MVFSVISAATLAASAAFAAQPLVWPQFRGPGATGVAEGQKPPVKFGLDTNLKWKVSAPSGFSSPIVVGDLLVLTAFDDGKLYTVAYHREDGSEAWRKEAPAKKIEPFHHTEGTPAASTPATDGTRIVSYFGSCGLFCYDLAGKELWRYELPTASTPFDFGTGVSPIIVDGLVVLQRDENKTPLILAVDLATGTKKWEKERQSKSSYCTPAVWRTASGTEIVSPGFSRMIGYDLATGEEKWTVLGMPAATCATPVVHDGNLFFAGWSPGEDMKLPGFDQLLKASGQTEQGYITKDGLEKTFMKGMFDSQDVDHDGKLTRKEWDDALAMISTSRNSAFCLKPGGKGDVTKSHMVWKKTQGLPYVPSGIVYQEQYVLVKDGGIVTCYDTKTGAEVYGPKRLAAPGRYYSSPVAANGNIYFTSLDDGAVTVVKAGAKEPKIVARNKPLGERVAATPAIADDVLYIRTEKQLMAFAEKK